MMVELRVPVAVGVNCRVTLQLPPPAKVPVQSVAVCEKSPALTSAVTPVKGRLPVFITVTLPVVLAKLAIAEPKLTLEGVAARIAALPEPPSATE